MGGESCSKVKMEPLLPAPTLHCVNVLQTNKAQIIRIKSAGGKSNICIYKVRLPIVGKKKIARGTMTKNTSKNNIQKKERLREKLWHVSPDFLVSIPKQ